MYLNVKNICFKNPTILEYKNSIKKTKKVSCIRVNFLVKNIIWLLN